MIEPAAQPVRGAGQSGVDIAPADVTIGMRVRVDFSPIAEGWLLPIFRLASA